MRSYHVEQETTSNHCGGTWCEKKNAYICTTGPLCWQQKLTEHCKINSNKNFFKKNAHNIFLSDVNYKIIKS